MRLKKLISGILVISLLQWVIPTQSYSTTIPQKKPTGIYLSYSTASRITSDLLVCKEVKKENIVLTEEVSVINQQKQLQEIKIYNLSENFKEESIQKDKFKKEFIAKDKKYNDLLENTPSRTTWFLSGFVAALLSTLLITFAIK